MNVDLQAFEPLWGQWRVDSLIGEGSFGRVYKVFREDFGRTYYSAVKHISIPQNQSQADMALEEGYGTDHNTLMDYFRDVVHGIVSEIEVMNKLQGDSHIVSYADHLIVEKKDGVGWDIIIRMELLTPLSKYFAKKAYTVQDIVQIGIDICQGLERCQKINLIHRDIKPSNIFVSDNGDYKLGDFGISRQIEKTTLGLSRKGTPLYMAPEVYLGRAYNSTVDTYSLAIVLYRYLNNSRLPFVKAIGRFTQEDNEKALDRRISGEVMPSPVNADSKLAEIICKACSFNPKDRYESAKAFRSDLESVYSSICNMAPVVIGNTYQDSDMNSAGLNSQVLSSCSQSTNNQSNTLPEKEGTVGLNLGSPERKQIVQKDVAESVDISPEEAVLPDTAVLESDASKTRNPFMTWRKKKTILVLTSILILLVLVSVLAWTAFSRVPQKKLSLVTTVAELSVGETFQFKTAEGQGSNLVWESSDPSIAVIDENGNVTAKAPGEVTISVSISGTKIVAQQTMKVLAGIKGIQISKTNTTILVGGQEQLVVVSDPQGQSLPELIWESTNTAVASVDKAGLVTAISEGNTVIKVHDTKGLYESSCTISVQATAVTVTGIQIEPASIELQIGQQATLTCAITPANATNQTVTWSSNNPAIVSVDGTGVVTAMGQGDAIITVQSKDGNFSSICKIHVAAPTPETTKETTKDTTKATTAASWSDWTTSLPSGVSESNYSIDKKMQYRSRQLATQTSGPSDWLTTDPSGANRTVEQQYQTRTKTYTTNTASSLPGWSQYGSPTVTYGSWSTWSTTAATASAVQGVESKDVGTMTYKTVYNYSSWKYVNGGATYYSYASGWGGLPGEWLYKTTDTPLTQTGTYDGYPGYLSGGVIWFNQTTSQAEAGTVYHKEYRVRSITTTYNYWQWGAWSDWQAGSYTGSTTDTEVNNRYRYIETTSSWSDWSAWGDAAITATSTTDVQTQILYRYKKIG